MPLRAWKALLTQLLELGGDTELKPCAMPLCHFLIPQGGDKRTCAVVGPIQRLGIMILPAGVVLTHRAHQEGKDD